MGVASPSTRRRQCEKFYRLRLPRACCSARPRCASLRAARKIARQGKRCRIRDPCEASRAPPATLPVSGCRTKEANPVSRGPPATPRVNKTRQVDREAAAAEVTQGLRRRAEALRRGRSALSKLRERCAGIQTCPSSCPGKLSEPPYGALSCTPLRAQRGGWHEMASSLRDFARPAGLSEPQSDSSVGTLAGYVTECTDDWSSRQQARSC